MTDLPRMGILGGTFDPVHYGHLDAARAAWRALALDEVLLMPSREPPHKASSGQVSSDHRLAMTSLAVSQHQELRASDLELRSSAPSYTSRTLKRLARDGYDPSQLFFILGSDAFADIAQWYDYPDLLDRGHFAVVARRDCPVSDLPRRLPALVGRMRRPERSMFAGAPSATTAIWLIEAETRDVSSSVVRNRLAHAQSVDELLPDAVAAYVARHGLYGSGTPGGSFA